MTNTEPICDRCGEHILNGWYHIDCQPPLYAEIDRLRAELSKTEKAYQELAHRWDSLSGYNPLMTPADNWNRLKAELAAAKAELHSWRGCPSCHEDHGPESICPPYEVRTTGSDNLHWQRNLWEGRTRAARAELAAARKRVAGLEQLISSEPRTKTLLPDFAQRLWQACITLAEKAEFKVVLGHIEQLEERLTQAEAERDKMAAALEWYADPANYLNSVPGHWGEWQEAEPDGNRRKWMQDRGQRARQALGRE